MLRISALVIGCLAFLGAALVSVPLGAAAVAPVPATPSPPPGVVARPTLTPSQVPTLSPTLAPTLVPLPSPTAEPQDPPELRAVWVDAFHDGFKTPEQVDELVAWARRANINALFVQVRRRGDAYYSISFEPRTEDPDLAPGFDALRYLIARAHQGPQRLQVHAWLATLPVWWQRDTPPVAPNHAFNLHGLNVDPDQTWLMSKVEQTPRMENRQMVMVLTPR